MVIRAGPLPPHPATTRVGGVLNPKQLEAARLVGEGVSRAETARRVGVSPRTIDRWKELPEFARATSTEMLVTVGPALQPEEAEQPAVAPLDPSEAWLYSELGTERRSRTRQVAEGITGDDEAFTFREETTEWDEPVVLSTRFIGSRINPRDPDGVVLLHFVDDDPAEAKRVHDALAAGIGPV
jgi:hypothetical protein